MRVYLGPYKRYWGPYQIADLLRYVGVSSERCDQIGEALGSYPLVEKICNWVCEKRGARVARVRIDGYDVWNVDTTIATIALPLLRKLREVKHGSPHVDDSDVPENLRSSSSVMIEDDHTDSNTHNRWDWVIGEMIWAMAFKVGEVPEARDYSDNWRANEDRAENGYRLFGKYFSALWD